MTCNGVPENLVPGLVTLGLTKIRTADPLPMISHQVETQFIASQPFPVSVSPSHVPCWGGKCQHHDMETLTVPEYALQLCCQMLALLVLPRISPFALKILQNKLQFFFQHAKIVCFLVILIEACLCPQYISIDCVI